MGVPILAQWVKLDSVPGPRISIVLQVWPFKKKGGGQQGSFFLLLNPLLDFSFVLLRMRLG